MILGDMEILKPYEGGSHGLTPNQLGGPTMVREFSGSVSGLPGTPADEEVALRRGANVVRPEAGGARPQFEKSARQMVGAADPSAGEAQSYRETLRVARGGSLRARREARR